MQSINKILCNMSQSLTGAEKYIARTNLDSFGIYDITEAEQSQTVGGGSVNLAYTVGNSLHKGVYLLNINLSVSPGGSVPTDKAVPCVIFVDENRPGGGVSANTRFTGALTRIESSGGYELGMTVMLPVVQSDSLSFRFNFEFEIGKLPQGTVVKFNAEGVLIGNVEPTP